MKFLTWLQPVLPRETLREKESVGSAIILLFKKVWVELSQKSAPKLWRKMRTKVSHEFSAICESAKIA